MRKLRKAVRIMLVGIVAAVVGGITVGQPARADIPSTFQIRNNGSGMCLEPWLYWDLPIRQFDCSGAATQKWALDWGTSSTYALVYNRADESMCLAVKGGGSADRTPLVWESCRFTDSQRWKVEVVPLGVRFVSKIGGKCADIAYGSLQSGAYAWLYRCTDYNYAQAFSTPPA